MTNSRVEAEHEAPGDRGERGAVVELDVDGQPVGRRARNRPGPQRPVLHDVHREARHQRRRLLAGLADAPPRHVGGAQPRAVGPIHVDAAAGPERRDADRQPPEARGRHEAHLRRVARREAAGRGRLVAVETEEARPGAAGLGGRGGRDRGGRGRVAVGGGQRLLDDAQQALRARGLGLEEVHADAHAEFALRRLRVRRERADELLLFSFDARLPLSNRLRAAVAVHHGHLDVEEHEVVQPRLHLRERLPAVLDDVDRVAALLERLLEVASHGERVVGDEHARPLRRRQRVLAAEVGERPRPRDGRERRVDVDAVGVGDLRRDGGLVGRRARVSGLGRASAFGRRLICGRRSGRVLLRRAALALRVEAGRLGAVFRCEVREAAVGFAQLR
mmetsp:Transcript_20379/g.64105  ORF Transcript_20379/g.64105 Transcript_20379/m.64105 type:complete len:390 (+) Transcript_20379:61-1230(+)